MLKGNRRPKRSARAYFQSREEILDKAHFVIVIYVSLEIRALFGSHGAPILVSLLHRPAFGKDSALMEPRQNRSFWFFGKKVALSWVGVGVGWGNEKQNEIWILDLILFLFV